MQNISNKLLLEFNGNSIILRQMKKITRII